MPQFILSPQAQKRLKQIRDYTLKHYGNRQKKLYMTMIRDKMHQAACNPISEGRARDEIKPGYYSIRAEKHYVYYRVRDAHIDVIDVLHESMEPNRHI